MCFNVFFVFSICGTSLWINSYLIRMVNNIRIAEMRSLKHNDLLESTNLKCDTNPH